MYLNIVYLSIQLFLYAVVTANLCTHTELYTRNNKSIRIYYQMQRHEKRKLTIGQIINSYKPKKNAHIYTHVHTKSFSRKQNLYIVSVC